MEPASAPGCSCARMNDVCGAEPVSRAAIAPGRCLGVGRVILNALLRTPAQETNREWTQIHANKRPSVSAFIRVNSRPFAVQTQVATSVSEWTAFRATAPRRARVTWRRFARASLLACTLLLSWFATGCAVIPPPRALYNLAKSAPATGEDRTAFNRSVYDNVGNWVRDNYYDPQYNGVDWPAARERHRAAAEAATNDAELYTAINALLAELKDKHTYAQPSDEFMRSFWRRNIVLGWRAIPVPEATDGRRRLTEVFPGSPAAEAGVREGWFIVTCDGRPPAEVVGAGKLAEGQRVVCEFLTESGETRTLTITAREMVVPVFREVKAVAEGIYSIRFDQFDRVSAKWVREQVRAHQDAKAIIFDLRGNPGGHFFALGSIVGDVFPEAIPLGELVHRGRPAYWHRWVGQRGGARYGGKIAVLVSPFTTSAAEIFSQLVQENGRGVVVGQTTGGSLLTTVFWPLAGGGKLWLTVYDYHSPKGTRVEGRGVIPDIVVAAPAEGARTDENDPALKAAIEILSR